MKRTTLLSLFLSFVVAASAQIPVIEWQNTIGGNNWDFPVKVIPTTDGGYLVGGYSSSPVSGDKTEANTGVDDYWVLKLDSVGNIIWQNTIGGADDEYLYDLVQTSDGGYLLGGYSQSGISGDKTEANIGSHDYWIVKLDPQGNVEWDETIGGVGIDVLKAVAQTSDGGYFLAGDSYSGMSGDKTEIGQGGNDYWVVKTDSIGNIEWQNTIGGNGNDHLTSIDLTSDGGYVLGGYSYSDISGDKTEAHQGSGDYWVVKLNGMGSIEWQNTIGGSSIDALTSLVQSADGGYFLGGYSMSGISGEKTGANRGSNDYWVIKLDGMGSIDWQMTFGGTDSDALTAVDQTTDGGYILGGHSRSGISGEKTMSNSGDYDLWLIKITGTGTMEWQKVIGGSDKDFHRYITQTPDQGFILVSNALSNQSGDKTENSLGDMDYWVIKLNDTTALLPVDWGNITAKVDKHVITINWETLLEVNVSHYHIQRSVDGNSFQSIGMIDAKNDAAGARYHFVDEQPNPGLNYYRIKQVDLNEQYSYSHIATATLLNNKELMLFPNPAHEMISIASPNLTAIRELRIFNKTGSLVETLGGQLQGTIDLSGLSPGIYVVEIEMQSGVIRQKLVVQ